LPISYEGIAISQENIVLSAFKKAEDGDGYILRAYECAGKAVSCEMDCKQLGVYTVEFTPYEAKTLRIQNGKIKEVLFTEYDLSE
jgi:alpha-mannosidase